MFIVPFHILRTYFSEHKTKPFIWLFLAMCVPTLLSTESNAANRPNVVFILADDLGYGDVQCLNPENGKIQTPHVDKLASEGMMRFTACRV